MSRTMASMQPFVFQTRVRFIDTDASGRIHYTAMFRYFESAETEFLRTLGVSYEPTGDYGFPRVHVECDYKLPILFEDELSIEVRLGSVGRSSARFEFRALKSGAIAASGTVIAVCMDRQKGSAAPFPHDLERRLRAACGAP